MHPHVHALACAQATRVIYGDKRETESYTLRIVYRNKSGKHISLTLASKAPRPLLLSSSCTHHHVRAA